MKGSRPQSGEQRSPDLETSSEALRAIWPVEPPPEQLAAWASMSGEHRRLATTRLATILAYEETGGRDAASYTDQVKLSLPRFYSVLREWRRDPSLFSLVPQARGRARRDLILPAGVEGAVRDAVVLALDADEDDPPSRESIAVALHARFGSPALGTFRKLVARALRNVERERAGGFGRRIVVDSAALPLPLVRAEDHVGHGGEDPIEVEWAVAALCWDLSTGRILGWALDAAPSRMSLHVAAAVDAASRLRAMVPIGSSGDVGVATTLPRDETAIGKLRIIDDLERRGARVIRVHRGEGAELTKSFGGRLGRLDLKPRFAAEAFPGRTSRAEVLARYGRSPMDRRDARLVLEREITIHNRGADAIDAATAVRSDLVAAELERVFEAGAAASSGRS